MTAKRPIQGPEGRFGAPEATPGGGRFAGLRAVLAAAALLTVAAALPARADDRPGVPEADRPEVAARIRALVAQQDTVSAYPLPELDDEHMEDLLKGEIVRFQEKWTLDKGKDENGEEEERERHRVLAFALFPYPRDRVWVAAIDPHFLGNDRLSEARLSSTGSTDIWYQLMDPPWPVKNRHWVIRVDKPAEVSEKTHGDVWEQSWNLVDDGPRIAMEATAAGRVPDVPLERAQKSRYLEENVGSWTIFRVSDNLTLIGYQLTIVMGGWVPERLTRTFAMGALEDLMKSVDKAAATIMEHYDSAHEPIWGGNGRPVPPFSAAASITSGGGDDGDRSGPNGDKPDGEKHGGAAPDGDDGSGQDPGQDG